MSVGSGRTLGWEVCMQGNRPREQILVFVLHNNVCHLRSLAAFVLYSALLLWMPIDSLMHF